MLDEQQTLALLGWTLGSVCLGTFVLSALAQHRAAREPCNKTRHRPPGTS
jgi:hypothetical protein